MKHSLLFFIGCFAAFASAQSVPTSWTAAKAIARDEIYRDSPVTLYCGCTYTPRDNASGGDVDLSSCEYDRDGASYSSRAETLEWEHVVPASLMPARQFACWSDDSYPLCSEPGRDCCERTDETAQRMIFDLHNLAPSVGQVNAIRSNKRYGVIEGEDLPLVCDVESNSASFEPTQAIRGDVARAWLYMYSEHGVELQPEELDMFLLWSQLDQPDEDEIARNLRIKEIQGRANPYISAFNIE